MKKVNCILGSGSQIASIAKDLALSLGVVWDPDVRIQLRGSDGQLKLSEWLARDVRFTFGDRTVYLQVHVVEGPGYQVLLGRPFSALTDTLVQSEVDGSRSITIGGPKQRYRVMLPECSLEPGISREIKNPMDFRHSSRM
jgi:hypothetical protein